MNFPAVKVLSGISSQEAVERSIQFPEDFRPFALERLIDHQRKMEFPESFGWKHACISPDRLQSFPRFIETMFITIVRNPYYFVNSLFRRPYNIFSANNQSISEFIRNPIIANDRDNTDDVFIETPMQLWNAKNLSYLKTVSCVSSARLARYEDIVCNFEAFIAWLALDGLEPASELKIPMKLTKDDQKDFYDYRKDVLDWKPEAHFSKEDMDFIESKLDKSALELLSYSQGRHHRVPAWTGAGFFSPHVDVVE